MFKSVLRIRKIFYSGIVEFNKFKSKDKLIKNTLSTMSSSEFSGDDEIIPNGNKAKKRLSGIHFIYKFIDSFF